MLRQQKLIFQDALIFNHSYCIFVQMSLTNSDFKSILK